MGQGRHTPRFEHPSKKNMIRIDQNLYVHPDDPLLDEKLIRYPQTRNPESHYRLAQKYEREGRLARAVYHYREAMSAFPSVTYGLAKAALERLDGTPAQPPTSGSADRRRWSAQVPTVAEGRARPVRTSVLLLLLAAFLLLAALFSSPIRGLVTAVKSWMSPAEVVYEAVDVPFVQYFAYDDTADKMEKALMKSAVSLSTERRSYNVQVYGVKTGDPEAVGRLQPLPGEAVRKAAFVIAEYQATSDSRVRIRFLNPKLESVSRDQLPLESFAANVVRTALASYTTDHGTMPEKAGDLIRSYPDNYISFIPNEPISGQNKVHPAFSGDGGWVYRPMAGAPEASFYPNVAGIPPIPYRPVTLAVNKDGYTLSVMSGGLEAGRASVGLGKNNATPEGDYVIRHRVIEPAGSRPHVFGAAGLDLGPFAVHGTDDPASIGVSESLGCIRVRNDDLLAWFPFIPKGTKVTIQPVNVPRDPLSAAPMNEEAPVPHVFAPPELQILVPPGHSDISEKAEDTIFHWLG